MNAFTRKHWPALAVGLVAVALIAMTLGGYMDPTHLTALPLLFPIGNVNIDPVALTRGMLAERAKLSDQNVAILSAATAAGVDITAEQKTTIDANIAKINALTSDIDRIRSVAEASRVVEVAGSTLVSSLPNVLEDPKRGFKSLGDFALSVRNANPEMGADFDQRLRPQAATPGSTYGNESAGADGGYLVPTEFSKEIARLSLGVDNFLGMTEGMPLGGNSITFPSDETTPWGTNGVRAYWAAEAAQATATKPLLKPNTMRLNKLFGLVPVTDEILADAPFMSAYLSALLARSIKWKSNDAVMNGTGAGQPIGILKGAGLAVVNKDAGQATLTLTPFNVANMFGAMLPDYLDGAVWVITPDLFPKLITLNIANTGFTVWTPPMQGFQGAPGGFLFGKPVIMSQTAAAFSSQGDINFINFKAYRTISKEVQIAESMHLYFDADATAFRATFRLDGQPTFKQTVTQARGTQALSPYVTLQAR